MKALKFLVLGCALAVGGLVTGCEVSHTETTRDGLFSDKHEETTVTKNPVTGKTSVEHSETKIPN